MGVIKSKCGPLRMFALALLAFLVSTSEAEAQKLYWTVYHFDEIRHACLDGSHPHAVDMAEVSSPRAIAIDSLGRKIYWAKGAQSINRANLDGSEAEVIVDSYARQIAIDSTGGRIYWTRLGPSGNILRANLDGSHVEELLAKQEHVYGIALDPPAGQMYWTIGLHFGDIVGEIWRANLDGSGLEDVVTGLSAPLGLALDLSHGRLYWTEPSARKIRRANLDGTNVADVVTEAPFAQPVGIAINSTGGLMYWTDNNATGAKIHRADLDGLNRSVLVNTGMDNPGGITLDLDAGKLYWADTGTEKIQRANLDGTNVEDLVTTGLRNLSGIAIDPRVTPIGPQPPIPTVSQWGLIALTLLFLTSGTIVMGRERRSRMLL